MEWVWIPNAESLGGDTRIFTHWLYQHYSSPRGFDFDIASQDTPWIRGVRDNEDNNSEAEAKKLLAELDERAAHYLTDDVLMLMGDDFRYQNAE